MNRNFVEIPQEDGHDSKPLPLLNSKVWALGFLVVGVALTIILGSTMTDFFMHAYGK